jgi:UDP-N-acetylglucosamine diphosphorylase / glucose-1-phosphate thymidylyltransferase / UDP-N-acetylgalactosamine diphosphorylase / glucosamine-1-phosphate N-acetyltransferase / galactosamine-1-phosphate N-acetyltransferase
MSTHPSSAVGPRRVCLFEDDDVVGLEPLTLSRPAFDLLCGLSSLGDKQRRVFGATSVGALVRPHLAELVRQRHPHMAVNDADWLRGGSVGFVNARWLPPSEVVIGDEPCVGLVGEEVAYAVLGADQVCAGTWDELEEDLNAWKSALPRRTAGGYLVRHLWELVHLNGEQIARDFASHGLALPHPAGLALVGPPERFCIDPRAKVEPMVFADTTGGPVIIEAGAVVTAFTRLEGPCCVGPGTHVLGAKIRAGTTLGPNCRIGGEVEASIVQGHSNKYHDGFLGHAYVGEWVNLGAGTSNSDLRNDYGEVTVTVNGRPVATGMTKVGCFLGDHTKAGLGTLLNTGTSAGAFCNLLPSGGLLPRYLPSFTSWWNGALTDNADLPHLLATAATVMSRRGAALTPAHAALYRTLFEQTAAERRRALREAEQRRLRRGA